MGENESETSTPVVEVDETTELLTARYYDNDTQARGACMMRRTRANAHGTSTPLSLMPNKRTWYGYVCDVTVGVD